MSCVRLKSLWFALILVPGLLGAPTVLADDSVGLPVKQNRDLVFC
jgi:hypothetical protein